MFLADGTVLGGKILAENNKTLTLELREVRSSKAAWNAKTFFFSKQKAQWASEEIGGELLYAGGNPLLAEVAIPLNVIKQKLVLTPAEIKTRQGILTKDFYRKTDVSVYYYDLRQGDSDNLSEPLPQEPSLKVREDIQGAGFTILPELRPALQRQNLSEVVFIELLEPGGRKKIHPEVVPWLANYTVGAGYSLFYPLGDVASLGMSALGFTLLGKANFALQNYWPQMVTYRLRTQVGVQSGLQVVNYETTFSTTEIYLFPLLVQLILSYDLPQEISGFRFSPLVKLGNGVIVSRLHKQVKAEYQSALIDQPPVIRETYVGYAFQVVGGMEFLYRKYPQVCYGLESGYLFHAEKVSGQFVTLHFYATYRFGN